MDHISNSYRPFYEKCSLEQKLSPNFVETFFFHKLLLNGEIPRYLFLDAKKRNWLHMFFERIAELHVFSVGFG